MRLLTLISVICISVVVACYANGLPLSNVTLTEKPPKNIFLPMADESAEGLVNVTRIPNGTMTLYGSAATNDAINITQTNDHTIIHINNNTYEFSNDEFFNDGDLDFITYTGHNTQNKNNNWKTADEFDKKDVAYWQDVYDKLKQEQLENQQKAEKVKLEIEKCKVQENKKPVPKGIYLQRDETDSAINHLKEMTQQLKDLMEIRATRAELEKIREVFRDVPEISPTFDIQPDDVNDRAETVRSHRSRRTTIKLVM